jgi:hypothetical protein
MLKKFNAILKGEYKTFKSTLIIVDSFKNIKH